MANRPAVRRTEIAVALLAVTIVVALVPVAVDGVRFHLASLIAAAGKGASVPFDSLVSVGVAGAMSACLARLAWSLAQRLREQRRVLGALQPGRHHRVDGVSFTVFAHRGFHAFTAGLLRPRIYVSEAAERTLSACALRAVLAHEASHVRRRDPLRLAVATAIVDAFGWLPGLRLLARRQATVAELVADADAVASTGHVQGLSGALLHMDGDGGSGSGVLPQRVDQLTGDLHWGGVPSIVIGAGLLMLAALTVAVVAITVAPSHPGAFCTVAALALAPLILLPAAVAARHASSLLDAPA